MRGIRHSEPTRDGAQGCLLQTTIEPMWHLIRAIRQQVGQALLAHPSEFRSAAVITASELVENAIKYGESVPGVPAIRFAMFANDGKLHIQTVNGSNNQLGVAELRGRVDEITRSVDKAALYLARLERLLACASETGKLGLYRIAFEGKFELECRYEEQIVTMTATREFA